MAIMALCRHPCIHTKHKKGRSASPRHPPRSLFSHHLLTFLFCQFLLSPASLVLTHTHSPLGILSFLRTLYSFGTTFFLLFTFTQPTNLSGCPTPLLRRLLIKKEGKIQRKSPACNTWRSFFSLFIFYVAPPFIKRDPKIRYSMCTNREQKHHLSRQASNPLLPSFLLLPTVPTYLLHFALPHGLPILCRGRDLLCFCLLFLLDF
ncbi:MAG: hypothetical protein J3R72DRAFT_432487 [Linnemannia gamsii]|nr:MAG: hypothetical protein J3R72DRAFT_432487 [Linnemannia gamsii]